MTRADPPAARLAVQGTVIDLTDADRGAVVTTPRPLLELRSVTAAYGRIQVLHGMDLAVPAGSITALLGPNGGGKSTALKVASMQLQPTGGKVRLAGRVVNGASPDALARAGLCTIPEGRGIFPSLSVRENLRMVTYAGRPIGDVEERAYAAFPRLGERRSQLAGSMSGGEQQMLAMARALATDPALLMVDELSMGLAPTIVADLYQHVARIAANGTTVLVVEQFARTVLDVADHAAIVLHGQVSRTGTPTELEDELSAAYLGSTNG